MFRLVLHLSLSSIDIPQMSLMWHLIVPISMSVESMVIKAHIAFLHKLVIVHHLLVHSFSFVRLFAVR